VLHPGSLVDLITEPERDQTPLLVRGQRLELDDLLEERVNRRSQELATLRLVAGHH
jgi:hypothetical protein